MARYAGIYLWVSSPVCRIDGCSTVCNVQPLCIAPLDLPELLRRTPHGVEVFRVLEQLGFAPEDANGDDVIVASPLRTR